MIGNWWETVPRAVRFKEEIINEMYSGGSIVLVLSPETPWKEELLDQIEIGLNRESGEFEVDFISGLDIGSQSVEDYLFSSYCPPHKQNEYRHHETKAEFLGNNEDLKIRERYKIVRDISPDAFKEWGDFVEHFQKASSRKEEAFAGFILVVEDDVAFSYRYIKRMSCENLFTIYDSYLFSAQIAAEIPMLDAEKSYLAEVATQIGKEDIELTAICTKHGIDILSNTVDTLRFIYEEKTYSNGGKLPSKITEEEYVSQALLNAQIRTIFPIIELNLRKLIGKYADQIRNMLPTINSVNEELTEPEQVEIGMLYYWVGASAVKVSDEDYNKIYLLREMRNALAHRHPPGYKLVQTVLVLG